MREFGYGFQLCIISIVAVVVTIQTTNGEKLCGKCHYVPWAYDANCKNLSLKEPPIMCSRAEVIDLRYNDISELLENAFESLTNLYHVDLGNNHLRYIHPNAFVGNTMVRSIYLQDNFLTSVTNFTYTGVPNMKELYLNKNQISLIDTEAFYGLRTLNVLHISNNNLSIVTHDMLSTLKRLRYLYMANNHLKLIQNGTFSDLENLRYLDLNFNRITVVEADAFTGLVSLHVLKLAQNNIVSIGLNALLPNHHLILNISGNSIPTVSNFSHIFQILDEFYMEDNPLVCNEDLKPVISWYQEHNSTGNSDDPFCDQPGCLKGRKVKELTSLECWLPTTEHALHTSSVQTTVKPSQTIAKPKQKQDINVMNIFFFFLCFLVVMCLFILKKLINIERCNTFPNLHSITEDKEASRNYNKIPCKSQAPRFKPKKESDW